MHKIADWILIIDNPRLYKYNSDIPGLNHCNIDNPWHMFTASLDHYNTDNHGDEIINNQMFQDQVIITQIILELIIITQIVLDYILKTQINLDWIIITQIIMRTRSSEYGLSWTRSSWESSQWTTLRCCPKFHKSSNLHLFICLGQNKQIRLIGLG